MNIIDVLVILVIILCGVIGMKKGFVRTLVALVGIVLVFILAYLLKNPLAEWMCMNLPFFNFSGSFEGATILNVVIYQLISFFVMFAILMTIYSLIVFFAKIVEKILKLTFILAIPSKVFGCILGVLEGIFISLIGIIILSLPVLKFDLIQESAIRNYLFNVSPIVGNITKNTNDAVDEILELNEKFRGYDTRENFNLSCLDSLLKHKVIRVGFAEKLVYSEKLNVDKVKAMEIVNKYQ